MTETNTRAKTAARLCRPALANEPMYDVITPAEYREFMSSWTVQQRQQYGLKHFVRMATYLVYEISTMEAFAMAMELLLYHGDQAKTNHVPLPKEDPRGKYFPVQAEGDTLVRILECVATQFDIQDGLMRRHPDFRHTQHLYGYFPEKDRWDFHYAVIYYTIIWLHQEEPWPAAAAYEFDRPTESMSRYLRYLATYDCPWRLRWRLDEPFDMWDRCRFFGDGFSITRGRCILPSLADDPERVVMPQLQPVSNDQMDCEEVKVVIHSPPALVKPKKVKMLPPCLARIYDQMQSTKKERPEDYTLSNIFWESVPAQHHAVLLDGIVDQVRRGQESIAAIDATKPPVKAWHREKVGKPCLFLRYDKLCPLTQDLASVPQFQLLQRRNHNTAQNVSEICGAHKRDKHNRVIGKQCAMLCGLRATTNPIEHPRDVINLLW